MIIDYHYWLRFIIAGLADSINGRAKITNDGPMLNYNLESYHQIKIVFFYRLGWDLFICSIQG